MLYSIEDKCDGGYHILNFLYKYAIEGEEVLTLKFNKQEKTNLKTEADCSPRVNTLRIAFTCLPQNLVLSWK